MTARSSSGSRGLRRGGELLESAPLGSLSASATSALIRLNSTIRLFGFTLSIALLFEASTLRLIDEAPKLVALFLRHNSPKCRPLGQQS